MSAHKVKTRIRSYHYHFHAHVHECTQPGDGGSNAPTHAPMHVRTHLATTCSRRRQQSRIIDCDWENAQWTAGHLQVIARVSTEPLSVNLPSHHLVHPHYRLQTLPRRAVNGLAQHFRLKRHWKWLIYATLARFEHSSTRTRQSLLKATPTADDVRISRVYSPLLMSDRASAR